MPAPKGNKYALGNNGGQPPAYASPQEMHAKIIEYFDYIQGEKKTPRSKTWIREPEPPTVTGLALFLGFESRQSMYDYKKKEEFTYIIKRAISIVENAYEQRLSDGNSTGAIFALKNMGWKDEQGLKHTGDKDNPVVTETKRTVVFKKYGE